MNARPKPDACAAWESGRAFMLVYDFLLPSLSHHTHKHTHTSPTSDQGSAIRVWVGACARET